MQISQFVSQRDNPPNAAFGQMARSRASMQIHFLAPKAPCQGASPKFAKVTTVFRFPIVVTPTATSQQQADDDDDTR